MESNQSLFSLTIDPITKEHLSETAKWARFLAILGMISLVLLLILMAFSAFQMNSTFSSMEEMDPDGATTNATNASEFMGVFMAIYSICIAVIWFFPLLYLLRFANRMRFALQGNDQQALNESFQNLKRTMRYVGIVTIIALALMVLAIVMAIVGMTMAS